MTRKLASAVAFGACALLAPAAASAQTFVDVGVWTRGGGGRVVVGGAPVYGVPVYHAPIYPAPVYRPVYVVPQPVYVVQPYYRHDRGKHKGWGKKGYRAYGPYGGPYYTGYRYYDEPRYYGRHYYGRR